MTPSAAYASAEGRDAGHDDFQKAVFDDLTDGRMSKITRKIHSTERAFKLHSFWVEHPIVIGDRIVAFTDVVLRFTHNSETHHKAGGSFKHNYEHYLLFELKPKIHSVGAIIRQCRALQHNGKLSFRKDFDVSGVEAWAVVPKSDPKIGDLKSMFKAVIGWDWSRP
jgi:hypothetical protein